MIAKICACGLVIALATSAAYAGPWVAPGDSGIRNDIEILADAGVITAPVTTWPISWGSIAEGVLNFEDVDGLSDVVADSYHRIRNRLGVEMQTGDVYPIWRVYGAESPIVLRTFEDTPRDNAELSGGIEWTGDEFAVRLDAQIVSNAQDDQTTRMDRSYVAYTWKNQMIAASTQNRWWGPGWEGSLILSSNARPIPAITLQRNLATPFETKWLSWLGPWTYSLVYGQMEHDRAVPLARFTGFRFAFKPFDNLEIALSRTAQWCGSGRPCSFSTFWDVITAAGENTESNQSNENEPGNQLAGFDLRWAPLPKRLPLAVYVQGTAEDEAGGLPSRWVGLGGIEFWGGSNIGWLSGTYRVHLEYANTLLGFYKEDPFYNLTYNSSIYQTGYRYKGRVVGHAMDNDSEMMSLGLILNQGSGRYTNVLLRKARINTDGNSTNSVSSTDETLWNIEVNTLLPIAVGQFDVGVGYDFYDEPSQMDNELRFFLEWRNEF